MKNASTTSPALSEQERQQRFIAALWTPRADAVSLPIRSDEPLHNPARISGLTIYRNNGLAIAERAMASSFPTLLALLGEDGFAVLAKKFWRNAPPTRGDLGEYGADLASFIEQESQQHEALRALPFLADCAHLDWLIHCASRAPDAAAVAMDRWVELARLIQLPEAANDYLHAMHVHFSPSCTLLTSSYPIATIYQAHQCEDFAALQTATSAEDVLIYRDTSSFQVRVRLISNADYRFMTALQQGSNLSTALDLVGDELGFDFTQWLSSAVQEQWVVALDLPAE